MIKENDIPILTSGDIVGVVAPSDPILEEHKDKFEKGIEFIEKLGFKVRFSKNLFSNSLGYSTTTKEKAEDINEMFLDKEVSAIICAQGGENSNCILPYLDYENIKKNPKPFIGISDITCLLNGIYKKTGLVTFHGNDIIWGFGRNPTKYDTEEFREKVINGQFIKLNPNSDWRIVKDGEAEGILIGGNLYCLLTLAGTEYFPEFNNTILFIEDYKPSKTRFESMLYHLKQLGVFDKIKGLILGHIEGLNEESLSIISNILKDCTFPIIKIEEFGHNIPNTVIPIGMKAKIDTNRKEITYLKC